MSKTLIHTLGNGTSPAQGSPVAASSSRTAYPPPTKLVPLKRRRLSLENDSTPHGTSKMDYFVASATVVSVPVATEPLFQNVLQGLKYSINDSCQTLFRSSGSGAPPSAYSDLIDPSRSSECPSNTVNRLLHTEQPSEWSSIPALPSLLRPMPPSGSIGTLEPLPPLLDPSNIKPLPPIVGMDRDGVRLDRFRFHPFQYAPIMSDIPTSLRVVETPVARLLTEMQAYNQKVLDSRDAAALEKNAKKRLACEIKRGAPSQTRAGRKLGGGGRLNAEKPWNWRNSKLKKGARMVERRVLTSKAISKAAQFAIRKGKWRRNMLRRLKRHAPQETSPIENLVSTDGSHLEIPERTMYPIVSTGYSPMSICSVLELPATLAVEISSDPPQTRTPDRTRSPSNDTFSISSTPPNIVSDLPSEDYLPKQPKLPNFQTAIEDAWKAIIARGDRSENRSKSPDFQVAFDDAWKAVVATETRLETRPKSPDFQRAFEDAWEAVMANGIDLGSPPHRLHSPPGSRSPIPGLTPASWSPAPDKQATDQGRPSQATPLKWKAPPSPTWSPPANDAWSSPINHDSNPRDLGVGILIKETTVASTVIPVSRQDRVTPNLRLVLSPEPTLPRPLGSRYSEDIALPTPIDKKFLSITPPDLLKQPSRSNVASDTNSLFDGDLSDAEESFIAETRFSQRWRPRAPSPISTRATIFTRTPESRQLPTPSSLSPQPPARFPIRLPSIRSIGPMYLLTEVRNKICELEAEAQESSTANNLLKTQLWREKKAGNNGGLGGRIRLDHAPMLPIPPAALDAVISNAFVALHLRKIMTKKDDEAMPS